MGEGTPTIQHNTPGMFRHHFRIGIPKNNQVGKLCEGHNTTMKTLHFFG